MTIDLDDEAKEVERLCNDLHTAKATVERETAALKEATAHAIHTKEAQEILQHLAQAVQQQAHERICQVVSSCLSAVFDEPYNFKIVFERKRGRTEAHLRFQRGELDVDPLTSSGGGVIDVAAFALRVACLVLHRPRLSRLIVLDEPFRFVSAQYRDNVRQMLERLSEDTKIQIVMVTHIEELATGTVVELTG